MYPLKKVPPFSPQVPIIKAPAHRVAGAYFHTYEAKFNTIHNWVEHLHFCYVFLFDNMVIDALKLEALVHSSVQNTLF